MTRAGGPGKTEIKIHLALLGFYAHLVHCIHLFTITIALEILSSSE